MVYNLHRLTRVAVFLLAGAALPQPVLAQAAAQQQPEGTGLAADASDIVVTARKREERTIDVPTSIAALSSTTLARYATTDFQSIGNQIPQLMIDHNPTGTGAVVTIRGVGTNNSGDDGVEQAVSFNIDGVSTARGRVVQQGLFDLDNVQVLKGPQALYFGKNSPGGVVITRSKGPTDHFEGYVKGGYEFKAREYSGEAAYGGPITDSLGFRVALRGSKMDGGYVENVSGVVPAASSPVEFDRANGIDAPGRPYHYGPGTREYAGRLTLAFANGGPFKATFKILGSYHKDNGETSENLLVTCPTGFPNGAVLDLGALLYTGAVGVVADPYGQCDSRKRKNTIGALPQALAAGYPGSNGGVPVLRNKILLSSLNLEYALDNVTLTSITGLYKYNTRIYANFDYSTFNLVSGVANARNSSFTEELRAVSSFDFPVNFSVGAFYGRDRRTYDPASQLLRAVDAGTGLTDSWDGIEKNRGHTYSVVGELTWKIVPTVELSGGARYSKEEKSADLRTTYLQPGLVTILKLALPTGIVLRPRFKSDNVSPQVTLSWRPNPGLNIFVGYHTGFKSGGISSPGLIPASATSTSLVFGDEKVKGVEGGVKFQTSDRRLSGDVTAYHYKYRGLQVSSFDAKTTTLRIQNAGGARVEGVEANLNYLLSSEISLRGSAAYNRARFTTFDNAACYSGQSPAAGCNLLNNNAQDLTGRPLPRAPKWSGNLGATWERPINANLSVQATLDGRYSSGYFFTPTPTPYSFQKKFATLDGSLRLLGTHSGWELALIGRNLTDSFYLTVGDDRPLGLTPGSVYGVAGRPRTVELQASWKF